MSFAYPHSTHRSYDTAVITKAVEGYAIACSTFRRRGQPVTYALDGDRRAFYLRERTETPAWEWIRIQS